MGAATSSRDHQWSIWFERAPTAMAIVGADRRLARVNEAFAKLFGRSAEQLVGLEAANLLAPTVEVPESDRSARRLVTRCARPDGSTFHLAADVARADDGSALAIARELDEEALAARDVDRFFALSVELLCVAGTDGYFKRVSRSFTDVLGWSDQELLSRPFATFIHPDDVDATANEVDRLQGGLPTLDFENRYRCRDGSFRVLSWRSRPVPEEGLIYAVARDVTEESTAQAELERYATELKRSNEDLEQFAYAASHDLQEPLRMVVSFTELLARRYEGRLDERADKYIRYAVEGGKRMQAMIDGLLAYSRVHTRGDTTARVDLQEAADTALAILGGAVKATGAEIHVGALPEVRGDRSQLVSVLQNLLANALRFHRPGVPPRIEVGAVERDDVVEVFVRDHGIGIPEEHRTSVFEIFRRLHAREQYDGTGLGLALAKRIAERHGGSIWIEGTEGGGTTVRFTLPRHRPEPEEPR